MSFHLIPLVVLVIVVFLNPVSQEPKTQYHDHVPPHYASNETEKDYRAILTFITSVYKKIKQQDAELIAQHLVDYGKKHDLDPKLAAALIARESGFNSGAVSSTGAKGLGQIKDFNFSSLKIKDPYDIKQNVSGTVQYVKRMIDKFKNNTNKVALGLASYYQGFGTISRANNQMDDTTEHYVNDIMKYYDKIDQIKNKLDKTQ